MLWLNPETHIDTHTSGSLSAAALQLNWLQRGDGGGGGSAAVPPGTTQSAKAMVAAAMAAMAASHNPSHESGRDTSFSSLCLSHAPCHALTTNLMLNRDDETRAASCLLDEMWTRLHL